MRCSIRRAEESPEHSLQMPLHNMSAHNGCDHMTLGSVVVSGILAV